MRDQKLIEPNTGFLWLYLNDLFFHAATSIEKEPGAPGSHVLL
jgi:hypothetical protein